MLNGGRNSFGLNTLDIVRSNKAIEMGVLRERFEAATTKRGALCVDSRGYTVINVSTEKGARI